MAKDTDGSGNLVSVIRFDARPVSAVDRNDCSGLRGFWCHEHLRILFKFAVCQVLES